MPRTSYGLLGKEISLGDSSCKFKTIESKHIIDYWKNDIFKIPKIQRELEENKIKSIKNKFTEHWKQNENYFIHHGYTISLCVINNNYKEFWVVDGQHRLGAILELEDYKFNVIVRIKLCETMDKMINDFKYININSNIALNFDFFETKFINSTILKIKDIFKNKYKRGFNRSNNNKSKIIHINEFLKLLNIHKVKKLYDNNKIKYENYKYLYDKLVNINNEIENKFNNELKDKRRYYMDKRTLNKVYGTDNLIGTNFYLSLRNINWTNKLFYNKEIEYKSILYKKKKIPKKIRVKLFDNSFGEETNIGSCYVCNDKITRDTFEAGHIIAEHLGGSNNLNNLKCICSSCNKSMGTTNLEKFKNEYFGPLEY